MEQKKPRMTKAQRMLKLEVDRKRRAKEDLAEFQAAYHKTLLQLIGDYMTHFPDWIKYENEEFTFTNERSYDYLCVTLEVSPTLVLDNFEEFQDSMQTVQSWIRAKIDADREANELVAKKNAARAKLTKEELKLLGL